MSQSGLVPYLVDVAAFAGQATHAGARRWFLDYGRFALEKSPRNLPRINLLNVLIPAGVCCVFGMLFVLANPNLLSYFGDGLVQFAMRLRDTFFDYIPAPGQMFVWFLVAWLFIGLARPVMKQSLFASMDSLTEQAAVGNSQPSPLFAAFRNTLLALIVLFTIYLVFEFTTLWKREFPPGFYYAGYAHMGAFWLTVALALATVLLSIIFRGSILADPRIGGLRYLAWLWSAQNLLLSLAVFNRLFIYIDFNGLTRMRMVGLFGTAAVLGGLILVIYKIARQRRFFWLVQRQLWVLGLTVLIYVLLPIDMIVTRSNVRAVLAGKTSACMPIGVKELTTESLFALTPLINCDDPVIRDGVQAHLARHDERLSALLESRQQLGWTAYQAADSKALNHLIQHRDRFAQFAKNPSAQKRAIEALREYAYQWY